jgi:DNA-directed RNA polymerase specialized sigma24 family protein
MLPLQAAAAEDGVTARLRAGDRAAFDAFYEVNFRRVFTYALRRTEDRATAEWVTRATLTEVLGRLDELPEGEVPPDWLLGILVEKLALASDPQAAEPIP